MVFNIYTHTLCLVLNKLKVCLNDFKQNVLWSKQVFFVFWKFKCLTSANEPCFVILLFTILN